MNNLALLAKMCWRYLQDDDLVCLKFLNPGITQKKKKPFGNELGRKETPGFGEDLQSPSFIKSNINWPVGNGENVTIWDCNWIPCKQGLRKPFSPMVLPTLSVKEL